MVTDYTDYNSYKRARSKAAPSLHFFDKYLLVSVFGLIIMGLLLVASSSIVISDKLFGQPFHYLYRQLCFLGFAIVLSLAVLQVPIETWRSLSRWLFPVCILLLLLVFLPGIGRSVNGSTRWINLGVVRFQVSELVKLLMVIFLAGYVDRHLEEIRTQLSGFLKPLAIWGIVGCLLLLQPDFGATVVILFTFLTVLFLAGVKLRHFAVLFLGLSFLLSLLVMSSSYRYSRLMAFLDPWANQFGSGYQLTQSLIAFGRGGWFGVGLGESIQKLFYLPEAHTDFLFAVLGEELGLMGELVVIGLALVLIVRGFQIARRALSQDHVFAGFLGIGIVMWLCAQFIVNIGVTTGMLPTKGLTLPFMSYGGSSLVVVCIAVALLLRVDYESRLVDFGLQAKRRR